MSEPLSAVPSPQLCYGQVSLSYQLSLFPLRVQFIPEILLCQVETGTNGELLVLNNVKSGLLLYSITVITTIITSEHNLSEQC